MTEVTIVEMPTGDASATEVEAPVAEVAVEAAETVVDAAIAVAAIKADRDVEIAQIQAETDQQRIEAVYAADVLRLETELTSCRTRIAELDQENTELKALQLLTLAPLTVEEPAPSSETNPLEPDAAEVTPDNQEEHAPPPEPARRKVRFRWI